MKKSVLIKQLQKTGADKKEASELAYVASKLKTKHPDSLSMSTIERIKEIPGHKQKRSLILYYTFGGSFAVLAVVVMIAQSAMPGTILYNVKRGAEEVRTVVQPSYTEELVEKRKEELELLKQESAAPEKVKKAENAYSDALERYSQRRRRDNYERENERNEDWRNWNWRNDDDRDSDN